MAHADEVDKLSRKPHGPVSSLVVAKAAADKGEDGGPLAEKWLKEEREKAARSEGVGETKEGDEGSSEEGSSDEGSSEEADFF